MSNDDSLDEFKCALSDDCLHFLIDPIVLINCGHSACKSCILNENSRKVTCKVCGIQTAIDLKTAKVSSAFKIAIRYLYESMFQLTKKEISSKLNQLKNLSDNQIELLDAKVKYIQDEIDIRIESIKDQLDIAREKLRNDLDKTKQEVKKKIEENKISEDNLFSYDSILMDLQTDINRKVNLNEERLDKYQKKNKELNELIKKRDFNFSKALDINISNESINEKIIGEISFNSSSPNNHSDPICRVCLKKDLSFDRYKCIICSEYDLCGNCFEERHTSIDHLKSHPVIKFTGINEVFGEKIKNKDRTLNYAELSNLFKNYRHNNFCDGCGIRSIVGIRFRCQECFNFDLCDKCYENQVEVKQHTRYHRLIVAKENTFYSNDIINF